MCRLAQMFEGTDLLEVHVGGNLVERKVLNLSEVHLKILRLFGVDVEKCYLIKI